MLSCDIKNVKTGFDVLIVRETLDLPSYFGLGSNEVRHTSRRKFVYIRLAWKGGRFTKEMYHTQVIHKSHILGQIPQVVKYKHCDI